ncbi:hypothetical protein [uncultured Veillonella sp.]|uniref:hypothetical protein n=1 Tax=uncultured Veillonella sp. TaxID=159268 RepID=UPI0025DBEAA0|nr:hypothetical protein [uncultured Veillonella sp.]
MKTKFYKVRVVVTGTYEDIVEATDEAMARGIVVDDLDADLSLMEHPVYESDVWELPQ